jgi:hypothetical protein
MPEIVNDPKSWRRPLNRSWIKENPPEHEREIPRIEAEPERAQSQTYSTAAPDLTRAADSLGAALHQQAELAWLREEGARLIEQRESEAHHASTLRTRAEISARLAARGHDIPHDRIFLGTFGGTVIMDFMDRHGRSLGPVPKRLADDARGILKRVLLDIPEPEPEPRAPAPIGCAVTFRTDP